MHLKITVELQFCISWIWELNHLFPEIYILVDFLPGIFFSQLYSYHSIVIYFFSRYFFVRLKEHPSSHQPCYFSFHLFSFFETIDEITLCNFNSQQILVRKVSDNMFDHIIKQKIMIFFIKLWDFERKGVLDLRFSEKTPVPKWTNFWRVAEQGSNFSMIFKLYMQALILLVLLEFLFSKIISTFWTNEGFVQIHPPTQSIQTNFVFKILIY